MRSVRPRDPRYGSDREARRQGCPWAARQPPPAQDTMLGAFHTLMDDVEAALGALPDIDLS